VVVAAAAAGVGVAKAAAARERWAVERARAGSVAAARVVARAAKREVRVASQAVRSSGKS
jgi:hypothetical protein